MGKDEHQPSQVLLGHIARCRNAVLPGERLRLNIGKEHVGYVSPELAAALDGFVVRSGDIVTINPDDAPRLNEIAASLAPRFGYRERGEDFDVRSRIDGPVLATLDRGALPTFGVIGVGVHLNGYVRRDDGIDLWVAQRSRTKKLDPGKRDNLVGGGVSAGMTPFETLIKEAAEEADIPAHTIAAATEMSRIAYNMDRPEGLRRDLLVCYDLELPADFTPNAADGEVERFDLMPASAVLALMMSGDTVKFNVNLVMIDFLIRHALLADPDGVIGEALGAVGSEG